MPSPYSLGPPAAFAAYLYLCNAFAYEFLMAVSESGIGEPRPQSSDGP